MPTAPVKKRPLWAWPILIAYCFGLIYLAFSCPYISAAIAILFWSATLVHSRYLRKIGEDRTNESICTFARSFNCRQIDPWVLRAVYEELSRHLAVDGHPLPIRADDQWEKDLRIDPEDFGELAMDIAHRAGRSIEEIGKIPWYEGLKTVRDLVMFFQRQPKLMGVEQ